MDFDRQKTRLPNWVRFFIVVAVFAIIGLAANAAVSHFASGLPKLDLRTVVTATVERGDMIHLVRGTGQLVSEDVVWVSAQTDGRVVETPMLPGVVVEPNTIVLRLINPDLELAIIAAESAVQMANASLQTERARLSNVGLKMKSDLVKVKGELDQAEASYQVSKILFDKQALPEHEVKTNKIKLESLKKQFEVDTLAYEEFQESVEAQVAVFQEKLKQARAVKNRETRRGESLSVRTGDAGVLAQLKVEVGQQVQAGDILAKIVNPRKLKAVVKIPEVHGPYIREGQPAKIDTFHGTVDGRVTRIDPEVQSGSVLIDVSFEGELPDEARPDLSIIGMVEVNRLQDVLFVGRPQDVTANQSNQLYRLDAESNYALRIPVTIGAASINQIQIIEGAEIGDRFILSDMARFNQADKIRVE